MDKEWAIGLTQAEYEYIMFNLPMNYDDLEADKQLSDKLYSCYTQARAKGVFGQEPPAELYDQDA